MSDGPAAGGSLTGAVASRPKRTGAQQAAVDPGLSAWVTANAGAGKTLVLVDRVMRLLLAGIPPQRILCLTFTRAAAAEMANRLLDRLGQWALLGDGDLGAALRDVGLRQADAVTLAGARRLFAAALETPGGLKIQTIHAFCEALLKRFPLEAGLPPHFRVLDGREADAARHEAVMRSLAQAGQGDDAALSTACNHVARRLEETGLERLAGQAFARRGFAAAGRTDWAGAAARALGLEAAESEADILAAACRDNAFDGEGLGRAAEALAAGGKNDRERAGMIRAWLDSLPPMRAERVTGEYFPAFFTGEGKPRKTLATKAITEKNSDIEIILKAEQNRIAALDQRLKTARIIGSSAALATFAAAALKNYNREKARRAALDFDDLIAHTQALLTQNNGASWVMYKLDGGIDHVLVDEAQDTSPAQWALITALTDEFFAGMGARENRRTVFSVGDEKQSIYGFQGADPAVGAMVKKRLAAQVKEGGGQWHDVPLGVNFRSTTAVLDAVDKVFEAGDNHQDADGKWIPHRAMRDEAAGLVEWWPLSTGEDSQDEDFWQPPDHRPRLTARQHMVESVAERIKRMLTEGERLEAAGRPIRAGDILILLQRRSGGIADDLARALKRKGVAVAGNDRLKLAGHPAAMDLCAAARFALSPEDDLNLAAVLKGPFCGLGEDGLNEDDLMELCLERKGGLWAALRRRAGEKAQWQAAFERLAGWLAEADSAAPYDFFAARLVAEGGRRALSARLGPEAEEPIDEFLDLCLAYEAAHIPSLEGYLSWFARAAGEIKREADSPHDAVRIMTVHGAKGLEAPVVFLADAARLPDAGRAGILWAQPDGPEGGPVLLWPGKKDNMDSVCETLHAESRAAELREYRRLLYVAMTRARDRLYICGWRDGRSRKDGDAEREAAGSWHAMTGPVLRELGMEIDLGEGRTGYRYASGTAVEAASLTDENRTPQAAPDWLYRSPPVEAPPPAPLTPSGAFSGLETKADEARAAARRRGRLVHRLLEILPGLAAAARPERAETLAARHGADLPAALRRDAVDDVLRLLDDPAFADAFAPDSLAEVPVSGVIEGRMVSGRIDRLKVGAEDVLIVDYKSGAIPSRIPEGVPPGDLAQLAMYRALCRKIYPGKSVRCALLWTAGPVPAVIPDAVLDHRSP